MVHRDRVRIDDEGYFILTTVDEVRRYERATTCLWCRLEAGDFLARCGSTVNFVIDCNHTENYGVS